MEKKATRFGFGEALVELGSKNKNIVVLGADITESVRSIDFKKSFPDRFFSIGIAEQDMIGVAAGLSLMGKIPFASTYSVFSSGRAFDQIRTTVCYSELNVKIAGAHGGISVGPDGATHQALEDVAIMGCLPNMNVIIPCDYYETIRATFACADIMGPCYLRFGRIPVPVLTSQDTPFEIGKGYIIKEGKDITIFACGIMVYEAIEASKQLEKENISAKVVNIHTVKPLDEELIIKSVKETNCAVVCEEHQIKGGFCSALSVVVAQNYSVPMEFVAINDTFGESGQPDELMIKYGLTSNKIVEAGKNVIKRKRNL